MEKLGRPVAVLLRLDTTSLTTIPSRNIMFRFWRKNKKTFQV